MHVMHRNNKWYWKNPMKVSELKVKWVITYKNKSNLEKKFKLLRTYISSKVSWLSNTCSKSNTMISINQLHKL